MLCQLIKYNIFIFIIGHSILLYILLYHSDILIKHIIFILLFQPKGAADRCLDCPSQIERLCPYSAKKCYLERVLEVRIILRMKF